MSAAPAIELLDVGVTIQGRRILDAIRWAVPRGGRAAILGPNGSGKSTLLRTLTGYLYPTDGEVKVLGERLGGTNLQLLRRKIGVVDPTSPWMFDDRVPVRDAVLSGFFGNLAPWFNEASDAQRDFAEAVIDQVGLGGRADQLFPTLSTGERRRTLLARALVQHPEILIFDELTAGLDLLARETVLATIDRVANSRRDLTIVLVTHLLDDLLPGTDEILLLRDGRAAASGVPEEVLTADRLEFVFGCPVEVGRREGRWWWSVAPRIWEKLLD